MKGDHTFREILEQTVVWQRVLDTLQPWLATLDLEGVEEIVFVGCGSSYHLAEAAAKIFGDWTGARVRFTPASEVFLAPRAIFHRGDRVAVVALSRTGETSEVLKAVAFFKKRREQGELEGPVYGFTCTPNSSLMQACDRCIVIPAHEQSVVMTQAYTATLLALELWALGLDADSEAQADLSAIDAAGQSVLERAAMMKEIASYAEIQRFVFLGTGIMHPMAKEGSLKLQEMALAPSTAAYHSLEYRHGPKSTLGSDTLVVLLASERAASYERELLAELKGYGAKTLALVGDEIDDFAPHADYAFAVGAYPDAVRAILYMPFLHMLAYHRAMMAGADPDSPRHLSRSVII